MANITPFISLAIDKNKFPTKREEQLKKIIHLKRKLLISEIARIRSLFQIAE